MEAIASTMAGKASFHKLWGVFDLILPVLERQVDVVAQLVDHVLSRVRMAHHCHSLLPQFLDSVLYHVQLVSNHHLLVFSVESDYRL